MNVEKTDRFISLIGSAARKKYLIENLPFRVPPRKYGTSDIPFMAETLQ